MQEILKGFDFIGWKIGLNYKRDNIFRTKFGGVITILSILSISLLFFNNVSFYYYLVNNKQLKETVHVNSFKTYNFKPDPIYLDKNNFMFAISIDQENFINNPYYQIQLQKRKYYKNEQNQQIKLKEFIKLEPCTKEHWQDVNSQYLNYTDIFIQNNINKYLCPQKMQNFTLEGSYSADIFQFLKLSVIKCQNNTLQATSTWNPICKSQDEINQFNKQREIKMSLLFPNFVINPTKPIDYVTSFLNDDIYFYIKPEMRYSSINIYLGEHQIETDNSMLPIKSIIKQKFVKYNPNSLREQQIPGDYDQIADIYLHRDQYTDYTKRNFQKLDELVSYLGGFFQAAIIIIALIIKQYNEYVYGIDLANKLYDIDLGGKQKKNEKKREFQKISNQIQTLSINKQIKIENNQTPQTKNQQYLQEFDEELQQIIDKDELLQLNYEYLFYKLTCGKLFNTKRVKLIEKAIQFVQEDLDVFLIIEKLKEVEKLKKLLLNKQQLILFNFFPKPIIKVKQEEIIPSRISMSRDQVHLASPQRSTLRPNQKKKKKIGKFTNKYKKYGIVLKAVCKLKKKKNSSEQNNSQYYKKLYEAYEQVSEQENQEYYCILLIFLSFKIVQIESLSICQEMILKVYFRKEKSIIYLLIKIFLFYFQQKIVQK
ncbi:hypothetical protein IMG5_100130 [Ichthyophthirius multifiliis]|uniref:Transmembrane protein n=1 Tax=Ichthyophthirius multifiliis TaxID=5932 RepID=G0QSB7_ICHMU|nr:hypothetical protein IMG5_100130 [Ichthyophthirius multifiliis]EGR31864.1 hypothetical protein IMG5_100130 [Ichthyophthirius multifiliis]|eukprot:XP_004035350.1 hypothetical protein IMG5_100130 [Ichthyophthirius multifiliis]